MPVLQIATLAVGCDAGVLWRRMHLRKVMRLWTGALLVDEEMTRDKGLPTPCRWADCLHVSWAPIDSRSLAVQVNVRLNRLSRACTKRLSTLSRRGGHPLMVRVRCPARWPCFV